MINLEKHRYAIEKWLSILGALIYVVYAARFAQDIILNHRLSSVFPLLVTSFFIYFFLTRDIARQLNLSPYDWFITLNGTFLPLCFRPAPFLHDVQALVIIQAIGTCISLAGILSLNKSIGLAPANRGIKKFWAYKYIRHPIYAGYFITFACYCAQNFTAHNVLVTILWMISETLRIFAEEKHLSADPAYASYMKEVRWRMLPGIF
jgi:protein-S-isoprenylcysteine O-methyltransferase Ste14